MAKHKNEFHLQELEGGDIWILSNWKVDAIYAYFKMSSWN